jgi:broad specificity phosphatase PhoE
MTTIYFIRHGQSIANAGSVTMPHADIPLSELGWVQAKNLAELIAVQPVRILVSKYLRTQQTVQPLCEKTQQHYIVHPLLHEFSALDPSRIAGMTGEQRRPIANAYWDKSDPFIRMGNEAETFMEFNARVAAFIPDLLKLADQTVVVGHGIWFALLFWKLQGNDCAGSSSMKAFRQYQLSLPMQNCKVYSLEQINPKCWSISKRSLRQQRYKS